MDLDLQGRSWRKTRIGHSIWKVEFYFRCSDGMYVKIELEDAREDVECHKLWREWERLAQGIEHDFNVKVFKCDSNEYYDNIEDDEEDKNMVMSTVR